jgi:ferredoxin
MRISVDAGECIGHGRCYAVSPQVYAPDDEGFCADSGGSREVAAGLEKAARAGAQACPAGAIKLTES